MFNFSEYHLDYFDKINLGAFYTPQTYIDIAWRMVEPFISSKSVVLDSSCGYGNFFNNGIVCRKKANDIDTFAIEQVKNKYLGVDVYNKNALVNVSRKMFDISDDDRLIVIGNPPYNDTTSIIHSSIKNSSIRNQIDTDLKTRDLGMSFLLSYSKLKADYVCVLHPLSYLIKKTNFALLSRFAKNYKLIDGIIISSREFSKTSRNIVFPILIALYKRNEIGMDYDYIQNYQFKIKDDGIFCLKNLDTIANYIQKYPNKKSLNKDDKVVARFWALRDINALKRNKTFIDKDTTYNTVYVTIDKLPYYCYVDIFKQYIDRLPYFIRSCDVIIDHVKFIKIKDCFVSQSVYTNPILKNTFYFKKISDAQSKIDNYFNDLLESKLGKK